MTSSEYITRCRVPGCGKQFLSDPFAPPIIGQPNKRVEQFTAALISHLDKKHPQVMMMGAAALQEYMRLLVFSQFQCEDPNLIATLEPIRASVAKFTRRVILTDKEIAAKVATLELESEDEEGIGALLRDMRDLLQEQGRYAPQLQPPAPSPLVTP